jgi:hypothetical protein
VARVEHRQLTDFGKLRAHPFGFRDDKDPHECTFDQLNPKPGRVDEPRRHPFSGPETTKTVVHNPGSHTSARPAPRSRRGVAPLWPGNVSGHHQVVADSGRVAILEGDALQDGLCP